MVSTEYPPMPGGVGRYAKNLFLALKRFGAEVYVVCNERGDGDFSGLDATNEKNSNILLKVVDELRPNLVHVQLEHGLYGLNFGLTNSFSMQTNIDQFYEKCQVPIISTFHSAYPLKQWLQLAPPANMHDCKHLWEMPSIILSKSILKYCKRILSWRSFNNSNRKRMFRSAASIVFSEYMAKMLSSGSYKVNVIYHGAEPSLLNQVSKEEARMKYSLPYDGKIALALGFSTHTKRWDILKEIKVPDKWTILVNRSRNHYSKENISTDPLYIHRSQNTGSSQNTGNRLFELNRGFLADDELSLLFYTSDAVIMPYSVASGSGVMFDALAHGLPFVASDLGFFKEFAKKGLGITVRRKAANFSKALKTLEEDYSYYKSKVEHFKSNLSWDSIARQHITLYMNVLANSHKDWKIAPEVITRKIL